MANYSKLSDAELAELLRNADHAAFTEIYNRFKSPLYIHAYNQLRDTEEARDLVQDLFINIWDQSHKLVITDTLSSYLYTAVRNRVFRIISRKGLESKYISSIQKSVNEGHCVTDHRVRERLMQERIDREIDALPAKMKEIFLLSRKANLSHREIAGKLGISEPTVKKQVNNALKIMKSKFGLIVYLMLFFKIF